MAEAFTEFFSFLSTCATCGTILGIAFMVALSLPKSKLRAIVTEICSYGAVAFCAFYAISPVDCIPEAAFGPFGFLDDIGAVIAAFKFLNDAFKSREERQEIEALESQLFRERFVNQAPLVEYHDEGVDDDCDEEWDDDDDWVPLPPAGRLPGAEGRDVG
jgi:uncharacterized membrane protein YkvA (DUF1232 family)